MGKWSIILISFVFLFILGFLNRWPRARRHPLVKRLNFFIDLLFWVFLLLYLGFFIYWLLKRI